MRIYFDRKFRFGGYSQSPQELFNSYAEFAGSGCLLFFLAILGPFTGIIMLYFVHKADKEIQERNRHFPNRKVKPVSSKEYAKAYFMMFLGCIYWIGIYGYLH